MAPICRRGAGDDEAAWQAKQNSGENLLDHVRELISTRGLLEGQPRTTLHLASAKGLVDPARWMWL